MIDDLFNFTVLKHTSSTWITLWLYCFKMTHKFGHFWHDVLTLSTRKTLPSKAQGHSRHFWGGGGKCDPYAVCDHSNQPAVRKGGVSGGQPGQESLESCDDPQGVAGSDRETEKQSCSVAASPRVKRRSVATGSSAKVPRATVLNESTSLGCISQQPNCHMKNPNLYRGL